jgi:hypothetical protein
LLQQKKVPVSEVKVFIPHDELSGELFTSRGKSYLVFAHKAVVFEKLPRTVPKEWITNFDILLHLNFSSGRSFNTPDRYPAFPVIIRDQKDLTKFTLVRTSVFAEPTPVETITDFSACGLAKIMFVTPEFYCFPEALRGKLPAWAPTKYDFVYEMRKMLEADAMDAGLSAWIERLRGNPDFARIDTPRTVLKKAGRDLPNSRISRGQFSEQGVEFAWRGESRIGIVTASERVLTYFIGSDFTIEREEALALPLRNCVFFAHGNRLATYDRIGKTLSVSGQSEKTAIEIEGRLFAGFGSEFVYCPTPFTVWTGGRQLCFTKHRIVAITASETFQIVVFSTADSKVHFHSTGSGTETVPEVTTKEQITDLLITEQWGFVLMQWRRGITLSNINGTPIKHVAVRQPIVAWSAFSSRSGFDYVVCAVGLHDIIVFEAFYPERMERVNDSLQDVVFVAFDPAHELLIFVTYGGAFVAVTYRPSGEPLRNSGLSELIDAQSKSRCDL